MINPILQYTIFEKLKEVLEKRRQRKIGGWDAFVLGAVGKLCATGITYPYITIKSRMHVAADKESQQENMLKSLRKVVREEGWGGLYKGMNFRPCSFFPSFYCYHRDREQNPSPRPKRFIPLTKNTNRNRPQNIPERYHSRLFVRLQRLPLCRKRASKTQVPQDHLNPIFSLPPGQAFFSFLIGTYLESVRGVFLLPNRRCERWEDRLMTVGEAGRWERDKFMYYTDRD